MLHAGGSMPRPVSAKREGTYHADRPSAPQTYEAAAMLVTFVLFGHWMEMRSRRGTSDALQALFNLVPPKARVVRNGQAVEIPTADIQKDDIVQHRRSQHQRPQEAAPHVGLH